MTPMRTLPSHSSMKRSLDWINEDGHPHLPKRSPTPQSDEWSPASSPGNGGVISSKVKMSGGKNSFQVNVACSGKLIVSHLFHCDSGFLSHFDYIIVTT